MVVTLIRECYGKAKVKTNDKEYIIQGGVLGELCEKKVAELSIEENKINMTMNNTPKAIASTPTYFVGRYGRILVNGRYIGSIIYKTKQNMEPQPQYTLELENSDPIDIYDIGFGDRYIFFYERDSVVACAHQDSEMVYAIFASGDWYMQLATTYIAVNLINETPHLTLSPVGSEQAVGKYDANYISEMLRLESPEIQNKYEHLIHDTKNNVTEIENKTENFISVGEHLARLVIIFGTIALFIFVIILIIAKMT